MEAAATRDAQLQLRRLRTTIDAHAETAAELREEIDGIKRTLCLEIHPRLTVVEDGGPHEPTP